VANADFNAKEHIAHYEQRFVAHLDGCALWRRAQDPEHFLLHARKALEAAVYAEYVRAFGKAISKSQPPLDDLLKELVGKQALNIKNKVHCDVVRTYTNAAAHVEPPKASASAEDVSRAAQDLPMVVSWFLESRPHLRKPVEAILEEIGNETRTPPDAKAAEDALELGSARVNLNKLSETLTKTKKRLEELEGKQRSLPSPSGRSGVRIVAAAVIGAVGGAAMGIAATFAWSLRLEEPDHVVALDAALIASESAPLARSVDAEDGGSPASSPISAEPAAPLTCPRGMRRVAGGTIEIGQPIGGRQDWPLPAARRIAPIEVPTFCIHRLEVPQEELDAWRRLHERSVPAGCTAPRDPDFPAVCVADDEAARYCADRGWSLPSIAEWEIVAQMGGVRSAPGTSEWVEDTFPPAVFHRERCGRFPDRCGHRMVRAGRIDDDRLPAEPRVLFSWNAPNPQALIRRDLGFRCVGRPNAAEP